MYVLGIDGGGTTTSAVIADENGNIYSQLIVGRSNPTAMTKQEFEKVIQDVLLNIQSQNPNVFNELSCCYAGMAGVGEGNYEGMLQHALQRYLPSKTEILIANDAVNALYSGTLGSEGIVQIAGTGAITVGINEQHELFRTAGWGYIFDDEGSGYDLGIGVIKAVFKAFDGRGLATSLTNRLISHFNVSSVPDIIEKVYGGEHPRSIIAPLSVYAVEEALNNDVMAQLIIQKACEDLFISIKACHSKMKLKDKETMVVLSGGVFLEADLFIPKLEKLAKISQLNISFMKPLIPPAGGAIIAGLISLKAPISSVFVRKFNEQYKSSHQMKKVRQGG
ncbi:N-acetylglucosamine kinase [Psychrobacillus vulpis]|uniref:ATPase BadF/BadG/BcrA/BcrD type domain-containing protein n=1 Tax=Psychrobacillus vulpis TaxID=2325572 RepID=A0A544TTM2_9BACI|nr:BadF/BadG/BcrA/BcrD ATPase family protein [Psychrobacillus vulpis]TQR20799.1 hypothetical protein FG384_04180 [Psychrobacillus vulpis]